MLNSAMYIIWILLDSYKHVNQGLSTLKHFDFYPSTISYETLIVSLMFYASFSILFHSDSNVLFPLIISPLLFIRNNTGVNSK